MVWRLLTSGERCLAAAAPFYGPFREGGDHAFFNDTGARFNPHAAAEAWR